LHPVPIDGEALSSWLHRIASCHGTDIEHLGDDMGYKLRTGNPDDIDLAPPPGMIDILTERTGVAPVRLRRMSVVGWVPWLLDDMEPGPDGFATYVRQLSVLRPVGKQKTRAVPSWRPWVSEHLPPRACPECVAASLSPQPYQLLWAIPIVSSCPAHGCWLETTIATRGYFGMWEHNRPAPRPAPEQILALDQRTWGAFMVGHVDLPRRQVHAGIWFRLLRAIVDELSCPLSENRPSDAGTIRQIWEEAGYRARDGQALWHPYEQQPETVQRHTMEAAATAITLLENGSITGRGKDAQLFQPPPQIAIRDGTPPKKHPQRFGDGLSLMEAFNALVDEARINPAAARTFFNVATYKRNDADTIHQMVNDFIELDIPLEFHDATNTEVVCNTQNK
jgi:hypothetical protein